MERMERVPAEWRAGTSPIHAVVREMIMEMQVHFERLKMALPFVCAIVLCANKYSDVPTPLQPLNTWRQVEER